MATSQHEGSNMNTQAWKDGYARGRQLGCPFHHDLAPRDMADYLDGFLQGQAAAITNSRRNPGSSLRRRATD